MTDFGTVAAIASWFALNVVIGTLNGWILRRQAFHYPALLTLVHMLVCWLLAGLTLRFTRLDEPPASARALRKVRKLALVFCASVGCGNIALNRIYVSFAQMVTAAGPLFTIGLMYVQITVDMVSRRDGLMTAGTFPIRYTMTGKRYSAPAYLSMIPMCGGVMLCTAGEINFDMLGFVAVVSATLLRGVKSIVQAALLTADEEKFDSLSLLYHMSRYSVLPLGVYAALVERGALSDPELRLWGELSRGSMRSGWMWCLVLLSGCVAFLLNLASAGGHSDSVARRGGRSGSARWT